MIKNLRSKHQDLNASNVFSTIKSQSFTLVKEDIHQDIKRNFVMNHFLEGSEDLYFYL